MCAARTKNFYEWLEQSNGHLIPDGPPIWICGDCHVGNLGPVADAKGKVSIQIRDLDQTVIGNPAHDLIRLGLSLATAARGSDLPGVTTAHMVEHMMDGYENALGPAEDKESDSPCPIPWSRVLKQRLPAALAPSRRGAHRGRRSRRSRSASASGR